MVQTSILLGTLLVALKWSGPKYHEEVPHDSLIFYRYQLERMVHVDFFYRAYVEELMRAIVSCVPLEVYAQQMCQ
ncbi:hypothetical protein QQ045_032215 [Rhodiola kirilowii]